MHSIDTVYITLAIAIVTLTIVTAIASIVIIQILLSVKRITQGIEQAVLIFPAAKRAVTYGMKKLKEIGKEKVNQSQD